jgi:hypothetical protein
LKNGERPEKYHRRNWLIANITFPLLPFFLGGLIRLILIKNLCLTTFSASDLAICLALLSLSINQNLLRNVRVLENEDKKAETESWASVFLLFAIVSLVLFGIMVFCSSSVNDLQLNMLEETLNYCELFTFFLMFPLLIILSNRIQKTFKLRATIW